MKSLWQGIVMLFCMGWGCGAAQAAPRFTPVTGFIPQKYLGTWYEIARIDWRFERGLVNVTADYALKPDGTIRVLNQGYLKSADGKKKSATGKAKFGSTPDEGFLRVSFFGPFYADYVVVALDTAAYQWALVAGGSHDYLWILSRTPVLEDAVLNDLRARAAALGFDVRRLLMVPQNWQ